ncbi:MAG: RnfABCDGE type electron transport complex subunit B [candidate division WOR-3 bacterium]
MEILIPVLTLGLLALGFGSFLIYSAEKFKVKKDEKVEAILSILPGADCGACGAAGCALFAEGVAKGEYNLYDCKVGGEEVANKIAEILGKEEKKASKKGEVAVLCCLGDVETAKRIVIYEGIPTCEALNLMGGDKGCQYGCLGLGDCFRACPFGAIKMGKNGLPYIIEEKCTACGICVKTCPRNLFEIIPKEMDIYLACRSYDDAKTVKEVCRRGCIGCGLCVRVTDNIIKMDGNLAKVEWKKVKDSISLEPALEKCPCKTFIRRSELRKIKNGEK